MSVDLCAVDDKLDDYENACLICSRECSINSCSLSLSNTSPSNTSPNTNTDVNTNLEEYTIEKLFDFYPRYFRNSLIRVSNTGFACIITFWTKREYIHDLLSENNKSKILLVGNLYTSYGMKYIIQNSLLCPQIEYFICVGNDINNVKSTFGKLRYNIKVESTSTSTSTFDPETLFWNKLLPKFIYTTPEELNNTLSQLTSTGTKWIDRPYNIIESDELNSNIKLESEKIGFIVRDSNLLRLWKRILTKINHFGCLKKSENDKMQKELLGVTSILTDKAIISEEMPNYEIFDNYIPQVTEPTISSEIKTTYTYGSRLHGDDQITNLISDLKQCNHSRRAISVTWRSNIDSTNKYPPCLILVDFKIQDEKLYMTCYFRSHDIYNAYCMNVLALQHLQMKVLNQIPDKQADPNPSLQPGHIMIISNSAHVYEHDFEKIVKLNELDCNTDSRGYFLIDINDAPNIHVVLKSPVTDMTIKEFTSTSVHKLMDSIQPYISEISHALYLGKELYKAKSCIRHNETYHQS